MAGQLARIKQQIAALERKAQELVMAENSKVIEKVKGLIAKHGLSAADLGLVDTATSTAETKQTKPRRRAAGKGGRASVGVAMYRDPASGKTWTGRGKPPAWIVGAADRAPFLIGAEFAPASTKGASSAKAKRAGGPAKAGQAARTDAVAHSAAVKAKPKGAKVKSRTGQSAGAERPAETAGEAVPKPRARAKPKQAAVEAVTKKGGSPRDAAAGAAPATARKTEAPRERSRGRRSGKTNAPSSEGGLESDMVTDSSAG